jgi:hypothetical protein
MEEQYVYFENLKPLTQEVIVDLFVSIIENKRQRQRKEGENETSCDLCEIEQRPSQCIM